MRQKIDLRTMRLLLASSKPRGISSRSSPCVDVYMGAIFGNAVHSGVNVSHYLAPEWMTISLWAPCKDASHPRARSLRNFYSLDESPDHSVRGLVQCCSRATMQQDNFFKNKLIKTVTISSEMVVSLTTKNANTDLDKKGSETKQPVR